MKADKGKQIPIDSRLYRKLEVHAKEKGFHDVNECVHDIVQRGLKGELGP